MFDEHILWKICKFLGQESLKLRLLYRDIPFFDMIKDIINSKSFLSRPSHYMKRLIRFADIINVHKKIICMYPFYSNYLSLRQLGRFYMLTDVILECPKYDFLTSNISKEITVSEEEVGPDEYLLHLECALYFRRIYKFFELLKDKECPEYLYDYLLYIIGTYPPLHINSALLNYFGGISDDIRLRMLERIRKKYGEYTLYCPLTVKEIEDIFH